MPATVALGSPLGREVAPREVGALVGAWLSRKAGLPDATHRLMIACGAGAGLALYWRCWSAVSVGRWRSWRWRPRRLVLAWPGLASVQKCST